MKRSALFAVCLSLIISSGVQVHSKPNAPKAITVPEGVAAFGWDFESADITVQELGNGVFVLF